MKVVVSSGKQVGYLCDLDGRAGCLLDVVWLDRLVYGAATCVWPEGLRPQ